MLPNLSLRGGRRPTWQSRRTMVDNRWASAKTKPLAGDSHVASLLGMTHQGSAVMHQCPCAVESSRAWRSLSAATDAIGAHHFNNGLYELQVPSRDCHVGLRPPRNDKPLVSTILTTAYTNCKCAAGRDMSLPYNARPKACVFFILHSSFFSLPYSFTSVPHPYKPALTRPAPACTLFPHGRSGGRGRRPRRG